MVVWNSEKDQIILKGIFKYHDIKNSKPLLDYLAKEIGEGCTPKAVSHRLTNLRSSGKPVNGSSPVSTPKKVIVTPRTPRTPASGRGNAKATKSKKGNGVDTASEDEDELVASPSVNRKRARNSAQGKKYAESDASSGDDEEEYNPLSKKVKAEHVEEEGATRAATNNAPLEEEDEGVSYI